MSDEDIAWEMADQLVSDAQSVFLDVHQSTGGNDGYVSFELDPLIEDLAPHALPARDPAIVDRIGCIWWHL